MQTKYMNKDKKYKPDTSCRQRYMREKKKKKQTLHADKTTKKDKTTIQILDAASASFCIIQSNVFIMMRSTTLSSGRQPRQHTLICYPSALSEIACCLLTNNLNTDTFL